MIQTAKLIKVKAYNNYKNTNKGYSIEKNGTCRKNNVVNYVFSVKKKGQNKHQLRKILIPKIGKQA